PANGGGPRALMQEDAHADLLQKGDPRFEILRKPPDLVLKMKRLVYDNDHPATDGVRKQPARWTSADGNAWSTAEPHGFRHEPPPGERLSWLRYRPLIRGSADRPQLITDFFGYNTYEPTLFAPQSVPNWVGDLILECEVTVDDPLGELVLELSRGVDRCRARWDLGSGKCTLLRLKQAHLAEERPPEDDFREVGEATTPLKGAGTHRLRFANVDQRLT